MTDNASTGRKVQGEIILIDEHGNEHKTPIAGCLLIEAPDGSKTPPNFDGNGDFSAELSGAGPHKLIANFDDPQYIFAFDKTSAPEAMPQLELPLQGGESGIQLYAWKPGKYKFGGDPKVDVQFARDTAKVCVEIHAELLAEGKTEAEAWQEVQRVLKTAFNNEVVVNLTCKTCRDRYYTPGTPYYMNVTAYNTCLYNPPCT